AGSCGRSRWRRGGRILGRECGVGTLLADSLVKTEVAGLRRWRGRFVFCGGWPNDGGGNPGAVVERTHRAGQSGPSAERKANGKKEGTDQHKHQKNYQHTAGAQSDFRILLRLSHGK